MLKLRKYLLHYPEGGGNLPPNMPQLLAICDACGLVFPSKYAIDNSTVEMRGNLNSCPRCGAMARIPDSLYNVLGNTIRLLVNSERTAEDLKTLVAALEQAKANNASPEEVKATLIEHAPELKTIADALPKTRSELYAVVQSISSVIASLIAVAALYVSLQGITKEQIEYLINKALAGDVEKSKPTRPTRPVKRVSNIPRSGKKRLSRAKRKAAKARAQRRAKH